MDLPRRRRFAAALSIQLASAAFVLDLAIGRWPAAVGAWILVLGSAVVARRWASRLAVVGAATVLLAVGLEVLFRAVLLEPAVPAGEARFVAEVAGGWPRPVSIDRPPGVRRIVGLSDSFGLAGGESNYHHVLPGVLPGSEGPVEVVNLSISQVGLADELAMFERFGRRYRPDLVLHGIFVGNDLGGTGGRLVLYRGLGVEEIAGPAGWLPRAFLVRRWAGRWFASRRSGTFEVVADSEGRPVPRFAPDVFDRIEADRLAVCRVADPSVAWAGSVEVLERLRAAVESAGARYVLVVHPDQFQVEPAVLARALARSGGVRSDLDLDLPQRFLAGWADRQGIACLDLLPIFRERGSPGGLYLERNTHYDRAGNRLAAEEIAAWLVRERLLGPIPE